MPIPPSYQGNVQEPDRVSPENRAWLFVSRSCLNTDSAGPSIAAICEVSQRRNAKLGVTGALVLNEERFAHYLEGPRDGLASVRDRITRDTRHQEIITLLDEPCRERCFADWSLAWSGASIFVEHRIEAALADPVSNAAALITLLRELAVSRPA